MPVNVQRRLGLHTNIANLYAHEVFRRLKFDVVMDREALEGASIDRVRECFRALVRSLELCDDENECPPPARNMVCLVLDAAKFEMLSNIEFYDDRLQEARALKECKLKAVSIHWKRPRLTRDSYRGVRELRVSMLDRSYELLDIQTLDQVEDECKLRYRVSRAYHRIEPHRVTRLGWVQDARQYLSLSG